MNKKLLITLEFPPQKGGVASYLWEICQALDSQEIMVMAQKLLPNEQEVKSDFKIYRRNFFYNWFWPRWLKAYKQAKQILKSDKYQEVIISQAIPIGYVALLLKKFKKIDYTLIVHGYDLLACQRNWWLKFWLKKIVKNAKKIIANSNYTANLVHQLGLEVDFEILYPAPMLLGQNYQFSQEEKEAFLNKYDLKDKKVILTLGRLESRKGQDMVIEAMPQVLEQISEAKYLVVGAGDDLERLQKIVAEFKLEDKVIFAGRLSDKESALAYTVSNVFVMPSRQLGTSVEGFGIVYLEANSFGLPVIGGQGGGVSEAVLDEQTGLLVEADSVEEIAEKMLELLSNPELAQMLGEQGRQRVLKEFDHEQRQEQIKQIFV